MDFPEFVEKTCWQAGRPLFPEPAFNAFYQELFRKFQITDPYNQWIHALCHFHVQQVAAKAYTHYGQRHVLQMGRSSPGSAAFGLLYAHASWIIDLFMSADEFTEEQQALSRMNQALDAGPLPQLANPVVHELLKVPSVERMCLNLQSSKFADSERQILRHVLNGHYPYLSVLVISVESEIGEIENELSSAGLLKSASAQLEEYRVAVFSTDKPYIAGEPPRAPEIREAVKSEVAQEAGVHFSARHSLHSLPRLERFDLQSEGDACVVVHPESKYLLVSPQSYFEEESPGPHYKNIFINSLAAHPPLYCIRIENATLVDDSKIISADNICYWDVSSHASYANRPGFVVDTPEGPVARLKYETPERLDFSAALLCFGHAACEHYSHFMIQTLPKLEVLRRAGARYDRLIVQPNIKAYQRETLSSLGVTPDSLYVRSPNQPVIVRELYVVGTWNDVTPLLEWTGSISRSAEKAAAGYRKIYVSRKDTLQIRRLLNEDEVIEMMKDLGFHIITTEGLSMIEEAAIFRQARFIAGPLGAGLYNVLFARPGAHVVAIGAPDYYTHWFPQITTLGGYLWSHYTGSSFFSYESMFRGSHNNWIVNVEKLKAFMIDVLESSSIG